MKYYLVLVLFFAVTLLSAVISEPQHLRSENLADQTNDVEQRAVYERYSSEFLPGLGGLLLNNNAKISFSTLMPLPVAVGLIGLPTMGNLNLNGRTAEDWPLPGLGARKTNLISNNQSLNTQFMKDSFSRGVFHCSYAVFIVMTRCNE